MSQSSSPSVAERAANGFDVRDVQCAVHVSRGELVHRGLHQGAVLVVVVGVGCVEGTVVK